MPVHEAFPSAGTVFRRRVVLRLTGGAFYSSLPGPLRDQSISCSVHAVEIQLSGFGELREVDSSLLPVVPRNVADEHWQQWENERCL